MYELGEAWQANNCPKCAPRHLQGAKQRDADKGECPTTVTHQAEALRPRFQLVVLALAKPVVKIRDW